MTNPLGAAANAFHPADSDWVVSIRYRDGVVRQRRISPGTITQDQALSFALASDRRRVEEIEWTATRRASDRTVEPTGADLFLERMRRMRT